MEREEPASRATREPRYDAYVRPSSTAVRFTSPCQEAIATLYSFLDGELTPETAGDDPATTSTSARLASKRSVSKPS